jgi:hypothetical protein
MFLCLHLCLNPENPHTTAHLTPDHRPKSSADIFSSYDEDFGTDWMGLLRLGKVSKPSEDKFSLNKRSSTANFWAHFYGLFFTHCQELPKARSFQSIIFVTNMSGRFRSVEKMMSATSFLWLWKYLRIEKIRTMMSNIKTELCSSFHLFISSIRLILN